VPDLFLRASERCPPSVPGLFLRATERCPPSVPNLFLRGAVPPCHRALSTVSVRCVPPRPRALSTVSDRCIPSCLSARCVPPCLSAVHRQLVGKGISYQLVAWRATVSLFLDTVSLFLVLVVGGETLSMVHFLGSHDTRATVSLFLGSLVLVVGGGSQWFTKA